MLLVTAGQNILHQNKCVYSIRNEIWIYSELLYRFQLVGINRYSLIFCVIIVLLLLLLISRLLSLLLLFFYRLVGSAFLCAFTH